MARQQHTRPNTPGRQGRAFIRKETKTSKDRHTPKPYTKQTEKAAPSYHSNIGQETTPDHVPARAFFVHNATKKKSHG